MLPVDGVNTAVSESVPSGRVDVCTDATPEVTVCTEPIGVEPSSNWTVPVAAEGVSVADRVTGAPDTWEPVGDAVRTVDVATG